MTRGDDTMRRVRRAPHVLCTWRADRRVVQSARRTTGVAASALVLEVLDRACAWIRIDDLASALELPLTALEPLLAGLEAHDLIEHESAPVSSADDTDGCRVATDAGGSAWDAWSPIAELFHLGTRDVAFGPRQSPAPDAGPRPPVVLPPRGSEAYTLPAPRLDGSLRDALAARRTHRRFSDAPVAQQDLGTLLGVTFGVQAWAHTTEGPLALKTSPSGGARHSLEAYAWVRRVAHVTPGLYHYRGDQHVLTRLDGCQPPGETATWLPAQSGYEGAAVIVVLASELARVAWRYRSARAYRVVLIESGHLAQTFCLVATALGLAPFCTAALADSTIEADLGLDPRVSPVTYAMGVGQPAGGTWRPHEDRPAPRLEPTPLGRGPAGGGGATRPGNAPPHPPRPGRAR